MVTFNDERQQKQLSDLRSREEEQLVQFSAAKHGLPYIDLSGVGISTDALRLVEESDAREHGIAGFRLIGKELFVGVKSPNNEGSQAIITRLQKDGYVVTVYMVSQKSLEKAWDRYADISYATSSRSSFLTVSEETLDRIASTVKTNEDVKAEFNEIIKSNDRHATSKLLEIILGAAIATDASDVHFEAEEDAIRLRFRQDGVLHDILDFDRSYFKALTSRLKLLSGMKITESDTAQDGRFTIGYHDTQIEVRSSTVPGAYGEGIVMRILNPESIKVGFNDLGIEPRLFARLEEEIKKPNGMILTTGPTGSGKTTTLYSFLRHVYEPKIKIITIEDPIEYHLEGITQTQTEHEKGYNFLAGLRAALRQDPDVIMVGEIRDAETADIAVQASLTGHLVLSTLHTNNAAGAIPRLIDLQVSPQTLPSALSVAMAQRLVRKLCPHCKKAYTPDESEKAIVTALLENAKRADKDIASYGVDPDADIKLYQAPGCEKCNGVGYKGRIGIFEAIFADEGIERIITKEPSERDIMRAALPQRILTMGEDGVLKALAGITSLEEIRSVVSLEEELDRTQALDETATDSSVLPAKEAVGTPIKKSTGTYAPIESPSIASLQQHELTLMVDYLKMLEAEQIGDPSQGIEGKIADVRNTIINILKEAPHLASFTAKQNGEIVKTEVKKLMEDLRKLQEHQKNNPDEGVAAELAAIRAQVESLL